MLIVVAGYAQTQKKDSRDTQHSTQTTQKSDQKKTYDKEKKADEKGLYDGKFRFAGTAGLGLHPYINGLGYRHLALQMKAGVNARMPVLLPDLYLLGEGRLALRTCGTYYTGQLSNLYLELPVMAGYTLHITDDIGLYAEVGPYLGFALIKFRHEHDRTHPCRFIDLGLGANVGVELMENIRLSLGFDYGLISPCAYDHAHNGGIWLTGTYMF